MRKIKRKLLKLLDRILMHWSITHIKKQIEIFFGTPIQFIKKGNKGTDAIYLVTMADNKLPIGVVRIVNPYHEKRKETQYKTHKKLPFLLLSANERLQREYQQCLLGYKDKLTPKPLLKTDTFLLVEYFNEIPLLTTLLENPTKFWEILCHSMHFINLLHQKGITHMDMSINNILTYSNLEMMQFIDFEYASNSKLTFEEQKLYDHLRLLESSIKYIPEEILNDSNAINIWQKILIQYFTTDQLSKINFDLLSVSLKRLLTVPNIKTSLQELIKI